MAEGSSTERKDALITIAMRCIKKLPYYLIEKTSAKNLYKKSSLPLFMSSFIESFVSFMCSHGNLDATDTIQSLCGYSLIYFPKAKVSSLISQLKLQQQTDKHFYLKQAEQLENRAGTSKKSIHHWVKNSPVLKQIFKLALEALVSHSFPKNKSSKHLISCINGFLK